MSKKIKEIHGERPSSLTDEDYQAILDAEEGIFYLTKPEMSKVEELQAKARIRKLSDFDINLVYYQTVPSLDALSTDWFKVKDKN